MDTLTVNLLARVEQLEEAIEQAIVDLREGCVADDVADRLADAWANSPD